MIIVGIGLYFPESRATMRAWTRPVLTPWHRWATRQELRQIAVDLEVYMDGRQTSLLRSGEFDAWLDNRYPLAESRVDSWGTRYSAEVTRSFVTVASAGRDRRFGTSDDISWREARD